MGHLSKSNIISIMAIAIILSVMSVEVEAKYRGVNQFCMKSYWKRLCNLQVKGANNYGDAVKNCINSVIVFNGAVQKKLPQVLSLFNDLPKVSKDSAISSCQDDFNNIGDNLQEALGYATKNDTGSISSYLSATNTNDCEESFKIFNLEFPPPVTKLLKVLHDQIDNCLAVTLQN